MQVLSENNHWQHLSSSLSMMSSNENRESFVLRWLDSHGLLVRHDDLTPEDVLTRESLEPWLTVDAANRDWRMFRRASTPGGRITLVEMP